MYRTLLVCIIILTHLSLLASPDKEILSDTIPNKKENKENILDVLAINKYLTKVILNKFPSTRLFTASYQLNTRSDFDSKYLGNAYEKGTSRFYNLALSANVPFYNKGRKLILTGVGTYNQDLMQLKDVKLVNATTSALPFSANNQLRYYSLGLNATYLLYYNKKLIILNATLLADGGTGGFQTVKALLLASYALKKTKQFNMTIGLVGIVDKRISFPIFPSFTLNYEMPNGWSVDLFLPRSAYIRKMFLNNRVSFGSSFDSQTYYFRHRNADNKQDTYIFRNMQLKTGAMFEHQISERFIVTLSAGMQNTFSGRLSPKNKSYKDYVMKTATNANFYIQGLFSVNF